MKVVPRFSSKHRTLTRYAGPDGRFRSLRHVVEADALFGGPAGGLTGAVLGVQALGRDLLIRPWLGGRTASLLLEVRFRRMAAEGQIGLVLQRDETEQVLEFQLVRLRHEFLRVTEVGVEDGAGVEEAPGTVVGGNAKVFRPGRLLGSLALFGLGLEYQVVLPCLI